MLIFVNTFTNHPPLQLLHRHPHRCGLGDNVSYRRDDTAVVGTVLSGELPGVSVHGYSVAFPPGLLVDVPAMLLSILFVVFMVCIHQHALSVKKIYSTVALALGMMSSTTLLIVYFVQVSVIQPGLLNGETEGIAMLSQYNPHGVFIAIEELGYLLMSFAFLFAAPVFGSTTKAEKAVRFTFLANFVLVMAALIYYIHREYRFEVVVISLDWLALIVGRNGGGEGVQTCSAAQVINPSVFKTGLEKSALTSIFSIATAKFCYDQVDGFHVFSDNLCSAFILREG